MVQPDTVLRLGNLVQTLPKTCAPGDYCTLVTPTETTPRKKFQPYNCTTKDKWDKYVPAPGTLMYDNVISNALMAWNDDTKGFSMIVWNISLLKFFSTTVIWLAWMSSTTWIAAVSQLIYTTSTNRMLRLLLFRLQIPEQIDNLTMFQLQILLLHLFHNVHYENEIERQRYRQRTQNTYLQYTQLNHINAPDCDPLSFIN